MFQATTATRKLLNLTKRIRGIAGGTSASKTISILLWLIDYAQGHKNKTISVVSETFPHLKRGAIRDFLMIMQEHGYFKDALWNKTDYTYTFESGSKLEFFSADQPGKVRGPRRDILFINEANNIPYETYDQLEVRTKDIIWLDWNPVQEFWWYTDVLPIQDVDFVTLTYKDNEALDPKIVETIESRKANKNWWQVYGLGMLGEVEGKIYRDWQFIDDMPHEARLERYGLDFGYSNDPTAIVAVYYYNGGYILDEVLYQKGLSNKQIADVLLNNEKAIVIADSAEPKSIDEIMMYGVPIQASPKGRDSVNQGIQFVQQQRISVTKRSVNLMKEYRNYLWDTDKDGKIINEPSPIFNHCFVGNTEIRTVDGYKKIKDVAAGDWVVTSGGPMPVIKRWDNGMKRVNKYRLQFDTFSVTLEATPDHHIKTTKGWKKISELQSGDRIFHNNYLGERHTDSIRGRGIFLGGVKECTLRYGNIITDPFRRAIMFIIKTVTRGIINCRTLSLLRKMLTSLGTVPGGRKKTRHGLVRFSLQALRPRRGGTLAKRALSGTGNTEKGPGLRVGTESLYVHNAGVNIKQGTVVYPNIAIQIAKLRRLDVEEGKIKRVYDLWVDGWHEYFANTILVHNCMDSVRYAFDSLRPKNDEVIGRVSVGNKQATRRWSFA